MATERSSIYCPYCHKHTALSVADGWNTLDRRQGGESIFNNAYGKWWIGVCNSCRMCVLVREYNTAAGNTITEIYPHPLPKPIDTRIPDFIKSDMEEAYKCLSISAYRATATLARRALQMICFEKGTKEGKLVDQINELGKMNVLTKDMVDWAHTVRWVGNDAAHPEKNAIDKDDAEEILNLVEQIIHILYIAPAVAREKREKFKPK